MKKSLSLGFLLSLALQLTQAQHGLDYLQSYSITARHSNLALTFQPNLTYLTQHSGITADPSLFQMRFIPAKDYPGYFWITISGGLLEADLSARPYLIRKATEQKNEARQLFKIILSTGKYTDASAFFNIASKALEDRGAIEYLDIEASSFSDNAKVLLYPPTGNQNQQFKLTKLSSDEKYRYTYNDGFCSETVSTSIGGGRVVFYDGVFSPAPVFDERYEKDSSIVGVVSIRELLDPSTSEWVRIMSTTFCSGTKMFYLNGTSLGQTTEINLEDYKHLLIYDNNNKAISEDKAYNLITIRSGNDAYYIPFYVAQTKVITKILGSTITPEFPQLILHDPPGDASYSFLKENTQTCHGIGMSVATDASFTAYSTVRLGVKGSLGFIAETEYEAYGELSASATMGISSTRSGGQEVCFSTTAEYSTANSDLKGTDGDVYIGFAQGLDYGLEATLEANYYSTLNPRYVKGQSSLIFAPSATLPTTKFVYTESHIKNQILPELVRVRDDPNSMPAMKEKAVDQLHVWNQILNMNQNIQANSGLSIENITFSSNTSQTHESETTSSSTASFDMNIYIDSEVGIEVGAFIGGSGASGGVKLNMKTDIGQTITNMNTYTNTIGFHLEDDDSGDYYSTNIHTDRIYGTPVFRIVNNLTASSCPYEGGIQYDQPALSVAPGSSSNFTKNATVTGLGPTEKALYRLRIANDGPAERTYLLRLNAVSNPDGAIIRVAGTTILGSNNWVDYTVRGGASLPPILIDLERGADPSIKKYGPIELVLYSECEPEIESVITLNAEFTTTGVLDEDKEETNLKVFPNPNLGTFQVTIDRKYNDGTLEIRDVAGRNIYEKKLGITPNVSEIKLNGIAKGIYFVRVLNDKEQIIRKLIIE